MSISALFIRRPVMTTLVMLSIFLTGITGYRLLPVSDLPNVDFPTLTVSGNLPGASPDTMASSVATPLERQFSTIAGLDSMNSVNSLGITQITLQFNLNRDIDAAAQDVQTAIAQAARDLPRDMPSPPSFRKVNPADQPVLYVALSSQVLPLSEVHEFADTTIAQRISMVSGVAQVQVFGAQKYAVRVLIDPKMLIARSIGIDEVSAAIEGGNVNLPLGDLQGKYQAATLKATGQLMRAKDYEPLIVAWRNGAPIRLGELGTVIDSVENDKTAAWYKDTRGVILAIQRQPGTNTIQVVDAIKQLLPQFTSIMPASMTIDILYDRSESIRNSVHDVQFTLILTVCLVVLVIFLFLRNLTATIIPALALILSVVGTFGAMYLFGFSLDNLSLMALTLSVGFVVDDAIVMLENIYRHMERGESAKDASFRGAGEIGFTILSMTISLVAVFIPVLFMSGIAGRLLNEFAITISVAILISGFISLTLTPMLCSRFLKFIPENKHGRMYRLLERFFNGMLHGYDWTLKRTLKHPFATLVSVFVCIGLTVWLFQTIPTGFLPTEDTGQIFVSTEASEDVSFASLVERQQQLAAIVHANPYVEDFMSSAGAGGPSNTNNAGRIFMHLVPRNERPGVNEIIQDLRVKLADVPGMRAFAQVPPSIRIGGQLTKALYQFTLQSTDTQQLYEHAPKLEERLQGLSMLQDVSSEVKIANPEIEIQIDRDKASSLGLSAAQIENAVYTAFGSRQISTIFAPNNQYRVILELLPQYQMDEKALNALYVRASTNELVPLSTVAGVIKQTGPLTVNHLGQLPSVTLSFNLAPGASLGDAVAAVNTAAAEVLPQSITTSFQGTAQAFQSSMTGLSLLIFAAVVVIYIVLGILYESYIHPITILSGLPAAGVGALLTLYLFGMELNLFSIVGIIMLVGIVKKNAIMMVDFAIEAQQGEYPNPRDAIYHACLIRFRPIMMTTMSALMGTLPIALAIGAGSESRRPLGMAVVGGLLTSQVLTLYVTPVVYLYMERLRLLVPRKKHKQQPPADDGGAKSGDAIEVRAEEIERPVLAGVPRTAGGTPSPVTD
jgi:HAE1 family hydrophobic/amphiphilic exporter-1